MKKTIELLEKQHEVLVNTIRWLDHMKYSNTRIREDVDKVLNHSEDLTRKSDQEIKQAREVLKRYEYDDES